MVQEIGGPTNPAHLRSLRRTDADAQRAGDVTAAGKGAPAVSAASVAKQQSAYAAPVDKARVADTRARIADGSYAVSSSDLASAMIDWANPDKG